MRNLRSMAFLFAATGAGAALAAACGGDDSQGGGSTTDSGVADTTAADVANDTSSSSDTGPTDASTDVSADGATCPATIVDGKIAELVDPASSKAATVGEGVRLTGVVATSPKFLLSKSKATGRCLYGVFVADANATFAPYSGMLVTSDGDAATVTDSGSSFCTSGGLIPDDIKPGDLVNATGAFMKFGPSAATCTGTTPPVPVPVPGSLAELGLPCAFTKAGTGTLPAAAVVPPADLVSGAADLPKWAGGLVRVDTVSAATAESPFGVFTLTQSSVPVGDLIYYRGSATAPAVAAGRAFTSITGLVHLDFCTWTLEPTSICGMQPPPFQDDASTCP